MYSEQSLVRKGIIVVVAALALGAASSASAEPRWTRMGPVDMPMPFRNDVARELAPPAPAEAQAATPASVAADESEVIALRQQVDDLTRRLANFEEQLNEVEREKQGTRRYTPIGR
jgi:Skp family chaperone for outer membrane proteins